MTEVLKKEIFIPIHIDTKIGRRAHIIKPDDYYADIPLARLLAKARILERELLRNVEMPYNNQCERLGISPRYMRSLLSLNILSPKIKRAIMEGYMPKHLNVMKIANYKFPLLWSEQERWFFGE